MDRNSSAGIVGRTLQIAERISHWWQSHRQLARWFPILCLALATTYVVKAGFFTNGPAHHLDTKYFFVASRAWLEGGSPYDYSFYSEVYARYFDSGLAPFVFPPPIAALCLPLGLFDWPAAQVIWDAINGLTLVALITTCLILRRQYTREAHHNTHEPWASLWLLLGLSVTGIPGTLFIGQGALFATTGLALLFLSVRKKLIALTVVGLLLASIKPQLTLVGVSLYMLLTFREYKWGWIVGATAISAVVTLVFLLDGSGPTEFRESMSAHMGSQVSHFTDITAMIGWSSTMAWLAGGSKVAGMWIAGALTGALSIALIVRYWAWKDQESNDQGTIRLLGMLFLLSMSVIPIKPYDLALVAPAYCIFGRLEMKMQMALLPSMLLLWRPYWLVNLLESITNISVPLHLVVSLGTLGAFAALLLLPRPLPRCGEAQLSPPEMEV